MLASFFKLPPVSFSPSLTSSWSPDRCNHFHASCMEAECMLLWYLESVLRSGVIKVEVGGEMLEDEVMDTGSMGHSHQCQPP